MAIKNMQPKITASKHWPVKKLENVLCERLQTEIKRSAFFCGKKATSKPFDLYAQLFLLHQQIHGKDKAHYKIEQSAENRGGHVKSGIEHGPAPDCKNSPTLAPIAPQSISKDSNLPVSSGIFSMSIALHCCIRSKKAGNPSRMTIKVFPNSGMTKNNTIAITAKKASSVRVMLTGRAALAYRERAFFFRFSMGKSACSMARKGTFKIKAIQSPVINGAIKPNSSPTKPSTRQDLKGRRTKGRQTLRSPISVWYCYDSFALEHPSFPVGRLQYRLVITISILPSLFKRGKCESPRLTGIFVAEKAPIAAQLESDFEQLLCAE